MKDDNAKKRLLETLVSSDGLGHLIADISTSTRLNNKGEIVIWLKYHEIAERCFICDKMDFVKNIIKDITCFLTPPEIVPWFSELKRPFNCLLSPDEPAEFLKFSPEYVLGFTLGLFESAVWYDTEPITGDYEESPVAKEIFGLVPLLLLNNNVTDIADNILNNPKSKILAVNYETLLSQAVKMFARKGNKKNRLGGVRVASVEKIISRAYEIVKQENEKAVRRPISKIGSLIFDQLTYALFGAVSTDARIKSVCAIFGEFRDTFSQAYLSAK